MNITNEITTREEGFTLVELLIAMVLALVVMGSAYMTLHSQQKAYMAQEQVAAMQQNLRAGMTLMAKEIRMVGYDPDDEFETGVSEAYHNKFTFSYVEYESGITPTEVFIAYSLFDSGGDSDDDLGRKVNSGSNQAIAENIDGLYFVYLDEGGDVTGDLDDIKSVEITMVARTQMEDPGYRNTTTYRTQQGQPVYIANDGRRRQVMTRRIRIRNL